MLFVARKLRILLKRENSFDKVLIDALDSWIKIQSNPRASRL